MQIRPKFVLTIALAAGLALVGCTETTSSDDYDRTRQGAAIGALAGAVIGASRDGGNDLEQAAAGAVIGGIAGGVIGNVLDSQERALRRDLPNNIAVENTGDALVVRMPQDLLFAVDSTVVRPDLQRDLRVVAKSLLDYPNSTVEVVGHTDFDGTAAYNQDLSERRARSVASILISQGVPSRRLSAYGRGEDRPIASNYTREGKAQNRRVEIIIRPTR